MAKPTIMDVAREARVSYATVSRFLNGNPHVSPAAAERIRKAVKAVRYVPNNAARSLVTQRTETIAFVMHGDAATITTDPNVNTILVAANQAVSAAGYQLVSLIADSPEASDRIASLARAGFADGWILNSMHIDDPLFQVFADLDIPVAVSGASYGDASPFPCVDIDNRAAAAAITEYLKGKGHRRIACIAGPSYIPCSRERLEGFRDAMGEDYDETLVIEADGWGRSNGRDAVRTLWERFERGQAGDYDAPHYGIDALACGNDCLAAGAMLELGLRGVDVPGDIAVTGFDDSPDAEAARPALTTVHQPIERFGVELADMVLAQIEGREPKRLVRVETGLVMRDSA